MLALFPLLTISVENLFIGVGFGGEKTLSFVPSLKRVGISVAGAEAEVAAAAAAAIAKILS